MYLIETRLLELRLGFGFSNAPSESRSSGSTRGRFASTSLMDAFRMDGLPSLAISPSRDVVAET